jgi:type II secretory pathway pseudopilin PulG
MKAKSQIVKMAYAKIGFTIIELLTVLGIIMLLLAMLTPALNAIRKYSITVTQKNQFYDISRGLELFSIDFDGYPDSSALDADGDNYCGAMKLCEAMVGQDGLGFHPDSVFDDMGQVGGTELYFCTPSNPCPDPVPTPAQELNLRARKKYLEEDVQIGHIGTLTKGGSDGIFDPCCPVLCDVYKRNELRNRNEKLGMPILYFKADPSKLTHDANLPTTNIYNYKDNHELLSIQMPACGGRDHPLFDNTGKGTRFYRITANPKDTPTAGLTRYVQPYNKTSCILISAGWDGIYGTGDDVYNFVKE